MEPMSWIKTDSSSERLRFIQDWLSQEFYFSELCKRYNISRKTGYKLIERFRSEGDLAIHDRSRARHTQSHQLDNQTTEILLNSKARFPLWGPRKIRDFLIRFHPDLPMPASSTIGELYKKYGFVEARTRRRRVPPHTKPLAHCDQPNSVWSADFKGQFKMGNNQVCYPLTISDNYSRYLLACQGLEGPRLNDSQSVFQRVFEEYGLPDSIRTDNGQPFAGVGIGGLTRLSIWWLKLGIAPERIEPAKPQQNGRHERMHRTLKRSTAMPAQANMKAQQQSFDQFRNEYNELRPHNSLNGQQPSSVYRSSLKPFPKQLPEVEYSSLFTTRHVKTSGEISLGGRLYFISELLHNERIGLMPIDEDRSFVYFSNLKLGILDTRLKKIIRL